MKVRCDRSELSEALGALSGIIPAAQTPKPILLNFHLTAENDQLHVEAMDLDMGSRLTIERAEVSEPGEVTAPAARFASLVRELPDREVQLDGLEGGRGLTVQTDGFELRVLGDDPAEFPRLSSFSGEGARSIDRDEFIESLRRVAVASSHDPARYQLTGVLFEFEEDQLILTATDGKRLTNDRVRIVEGEGEPVAAIVPNRAVDTILKVVAQGTPRFDLSLSENEVQVGFGRGHLSAKLIQGKFPDYRWIMDQQSNLKVMAKRADLLAAVKAASLMTDKETSTISFRFEDSILRLQTKASNIGESNIEVPVEAQGEEAVEIRFNPNYFLDALRCVPEDELRFEFGGGSKPGTLRGRRSYRHLIMPLVNDGPAKQ